MTVRSVSHRVRARPLSLFHNRGEPQGVCALRSIVATRRSLLRGRAEQRVTTLAAAHHRAERRPGRDRIVRARRGVELLELAMKRSVERLERRALCHINTTDADD